MKRFFGSIVDGSRRSGCGRSCDRPGSAPGMETAAQRFAGQGAFHCRTLQGRKPLVSQQRCAAQRLHGFSLDTFQRNGNANLNTRTMRAGCYAREASFLAGVSGAFTFEPNPQFAPKLRQIGYDTPDEDQLFLDAHDGREPRVRPRC